MTVYKLNRELWVPRPLSDVFEFFSRAEILQRITPPWMMFRILGQRHRGEGRPHDRLCITTARNPLRRLGR